MYSSELYAVENLKQWHQLQQSCFQKHCASNEFKDSGHGSASVRLETRKHLIDITAWDHASCLDIQILEIESEKSTFPTVGPCETKDIFNAHLDSFIEWLNVQNQRQK